MMGTVSRPRATENGHGRPGPLSRSDGRRGWLIAPDTPATVVISMLSVRDSHNAEIR